MNEPGNSPTVLDTLAVTGASPTPSRTGKVTSVPEPTTVLIVPAQMPATRTSTPSQNVMAADPAGCGAGGRPGP